MTHSFFVGSDTVLKQQPYFFERTWWTVGRRWGDMSKLGRSMVQITCSHQGRFGIYKDIYYINKSGVKKVQSTPIRAVSDTHRTSYLELERNKHNTYWTWRIQKRCGSRIPSEPSESYQERPIIPHGWKSKSTDKGLSRKSGRGRTGVWPLHKVLEWLLRRRVSHYHDFHLSGRFGHNRYER